MTNTAQIQRRLEEARERLYSRHPRLRPRPPTPLPPIPADPGLIIGRDASGLPFSLNQPTRAEHIDCVGATGAGKSMLIRHALWRDIEAGRSVIHLDPHGAHRSSNHRATLTWLYDTGLYRKRPVHVIDANSPYCTGLNPIPRDVGAWVAANHLIEVFERVRGDEDTMEKPTLRRSLMAIIAILAELGWTLAEAELLFDLDDEHGVRAQALAAVKDRYARRQLERLQRLASERSLRKEWEVEIIAATNRLVELLASPELRACLGQTDRVLDMRQALDEGHVVLANLSGGERVYETGGDMLGKLIMRAVLFAAKRRRSGGLATVYADECARYLTADFERALAELRKYGVSLFLAHQSYAQLGQPHEKLRQAVEDIPRTKICFRLNSMEEAASIAPDLMKLNLEMPVEALRKPTVVGHYKDKMLSASGTIGHALTVQSGSSVAVSTSETDTEGWGDSFTESDSHTDSTGRALSTGEQNATGQTSRDGEVLSDSQGQTRSTGVSLSESSADTYGHSRTSSSNYSTARTQGRTETNSDGEALTFSSSVTAGVSQALRPILKDLPSAVHSLDNVTFKAAEMLCSLPTGTAVVRTVMNGTIEGAVIRVPLRMARSVSQQEFTRILDEIMSASPSARPMAEAMAIVEAREQSIKLAGKPARKNGSHRRLLPKKKNGHAGNATDKQANQEN